MSLGMLSQDCSPAFDTVTGHWPTPETKADAGLGQLDGDIEACECLEVQASLLPRLRSLQYRDSSTLDPGTTLTQISQAVDTWKHLERCRCFASVRHTRDDGGLEVLLLTAINLRLALQTIGTSVRNIESINPSPSMNRQDDYHSFDKGVEPYMRGSSSCSLGVYAMSHEENKLIACLLLFRTLNSLHAVVARLLQQIQDMEFQMMNDDPSGPKQDLYSLTPPRSISGSDCGESCPDQILKNRRRTQMNHVVLDGLHQLGQIHGMLQKLEDGIHPLKSQAKAYISANT